MWGLDNILIFLRSQHTLFYSDCVNVPSLQKRKKYSLSFLKNCFSSVQPVAQSFPTLCDPMKRSTPGLPVHHQLPEFTQTHVHRVGDAIQPFHPLSSPFKLYLYFYVGGLLSLTSLYILICMCIYMYVKFCLNLLPLFNEIKYK